MKIMSFAKWLSMREDFHQGMGALGASLPMKPKNDSKKTKKQPLTQNPMFNIDQGQSVQGTRRDDGNG